VRTAAVGLGVLTTLLMAYLLLGILVPPALPVWAMPSRQAPSAAATHRAPAQNRARSRLLASFTRAMAPQLPARAMTRRAGPRAVGAPLHAGFYVNWDDDAWQSLSQHIAQLDWVIAEWGFVRTQDLALQVRVDPRVLTLVQQQPAAHRPRLLAMITNVDSGGVTFSGQRIAQLVASPVSRARFVRDAAALVRRYQLGGVVVDFEQVPESSTADMNAALQSLRDSLHVMGAVVAVTVAADANDDAVRRWGATADMLIAMLYDEHSDRDDPGPVASQSWYTAQGRRMVSLVRPDKVMLAFGAFGYEWNDAVPAQRASAVTYAEALTDARAHGTLPRWSASAAEPYIRWTDADSTDHVIWYLDAATTWNAMRAGMSLGVAGQAVWRLGAEDPALWRVFGRGAHADAWTTLGALPPGYGVELRGDGELLRVTTRPTIGARELHHDTLTGLISDERVLSLPTPWTVERSGATHAHRVALTFDDGPDSRWTPMILDTLRSRHATATFFVIGDQVQTHLLLTRRIVAEGHELGSHTFSHPDLSRTSPFVTRLELDATARLIEAVVGRRTMLFRPPYFGDAEPSTIDELVPVEQATQLGYLTAGVHVDSDDWRRPGVAAIVRKVLTSRTRGQVVLLHDGGGDRAQTVAALGPLIDSLRAHGDTIVSLEGLADAPAQAFMPQLPASSARRRWLAFAGYGAVSGTAWFCVAALGTAVAVGVVRLLLLTALAVRQRLRAQSAARATGAREAAPYAPYAPSVTVIVPAFNEQAVIVATVHSLLQQQYDGAIDVIVVDDGSPDDTYAIARNTFAGDDRVHVLTKSNGGKASALNLGITRARGEILVGLDADTVFAPDAIARLVQPLRDPRVGAVAGNAKVGNRLNLVTRWQALEYITSQNLDRRAFADLNAITVVPGAIGAWRATAVREAGGFSDDTLAEDQDLTIALRRRGWRIAFADDAIAYTEAPDTLRALARQRFRWAFGTLQCAWKHRDTLLRPRFGTLGLIAMPNTWIFQLLFTALSPLADLLFVFSFVQVTIVAAEHGATYARADLLQLLQFYALFVITELLAALVALYMEPDEDRRLAWLVVLQRFAYRQVMYWVVLRSLVAAMRGRLVGWGALERKATVRAMISAALFGICVLLPARMLHAQPVRTSMPITEVPAAEGRTLAFFWSGDGGWKELTADVSAEFSAQDVAVLGVNSRAYITSGTRSPETLVRDAVPLLREYMARWHRDQLLLVGYSRGAGFMPLLYEGLPPDLRAKVRGIVLIGIEHTASFEFHLMDLVRTASRPTDMLVEPVVNRLGSVPLVCVYGSEESDTICPSLRAPAHLIRRDGDHHFDRNYKAIATDILKALPPLRE
jgi:cellulose synthase/poly-beta-1,6-N-acetylglucosamine synthase-like glycosyltransferase/peptidoglycan/xylan/chitin deacetylase (PgdA/CDA1 family)/spore germination protein YaaH